MKLSKLAPLPGIAALLFLSVFLLSGCSLWVVKPIGAKGDGSLSSAQEGTFDATAYVDSIWDSKVVPALNDAADLPTVLAAIKTDKAAASAKYGHHESGRPYNFLVKGTGKVLSVDTKSRNGTMTVDLPPYDGKADATIQIGPVINGTALRDALPFIQFNQFVNQLQYADVANRLNDKAAKSASQNASVTELQGKEINFTGAFTIDDPNGVLITPVLISVKE